MVSALFVGSADLRRMEERGLAHAGRYHPLDLRCWCFHVLSGSRKASQLTASMQRHPTLMPRP